MSLEFLLELTRSKSLKSYTAPQGASTWTAPTGTIAVKSVIGRGQAGTPSSQTWAMVKYGRKIFYEKATGRTVYSNPTLISATPSYAGAPVPPNEYGPVIDYPDTTEQQEYYYVNESNGVPATTGASTTAFGQTFLGGVGGPAASRSVAEIAVVPGQTYNLFVAAGGSLTFTYLE